MLRVTLLGERAIIEVETSRVRSRSSRSVDLVAYLVAHAGIPQSRQRIAGSFWPESSDAQALTNLRRELHHLRQVLADEESLVVTPTDLCWQKTDTCRVDVCEFLAARSAARKAAADEDVRAVIAHATNAVAEYRGEFLPATHDDWVYDARREFEAQCVELYDLLWMYRTRSGDLTGAADAARRRIQLQPLEEIGYRTLMQLQADLGDRAGAVSTYHQCVSVLERELGLDPDSATRQVLDRLLARSNSSTPPQPQPTIQDVDRSGAAVAPLVGRSEEFSLLESRWRTAAAGSPTIVLVHGGAGVGKTRLVTELADAARVGGAVVAITRCFGVSGQLALAPVADWLRSPAVQSATATLDGVWRHEVSRLVPSESADQQPGVGARAMVDAWQRHRFFEGMARALIEVNRPMLLVLDNLQWCDDETLAFLTFLLGLQSNTTVMVIATVRDDSIDRGRELTNWTARMRATGILTELALGPLDQADTARLAAAISGGELPEDAVQLLQATTGGFPLYVVEAARTSADLGVSSLPVGDLTAVLRNRLEQVDATAQEIAGLAAAIGRDFTLDLLIEASDLDPDVIVHAVDELWRRRILRDVGDGYDFSHDLLRDTAYAQVSPPRRWLLHRRLAQGLELLHATDADAVSALLAEQYARSGRPERALGYYSRAATIASGRFAHAEAIRLLEAALGIVRALPDGRDRDRQELEILEAMSAPLNASFGYSSPQLQTTLLRSIELADALDRKEAAMSGLIGLWASQFVQGNLEAGHQTVSRLRTMVTPDTELSVPAYFALGGSAMGRAMHAEAIEYFALAANRPETTPSLSIGTRADVHGQAWAAHAHWLVGDDDAARVTAARAMDLARASDHPYSLAVALAYACITDQFLGKIPAMRESIIELGELCERYGFAYYREWGLVLDGWSRDDDVGTDLLRTGIRNLRAEGSLTRMPYWLSLLADKLARSGDPHGAQATLDAALVDGRSRQDVWWLPEIMRMRAAYDEPADAQTRLFAAAQLARDHSSHQLVARCERNLAQPSVRRAVPAARTSS